MRGSDGTLVVVAAAALAISAYVAGPGGMVQTPPRIAGNWALAADLSDRAPSTPGADLDAPARLTIARSGSQVIITTGDGRTTRLATDDSPITDPRTGAERQTRWENATLVSRVTGPGDEAMTERYTPGADGRELFVTVVVPARGDERLVTLHRVYDAAAR
jgi:hypothetical protein